MQGAFSFWGDDLERKKRFLIKAAYYAAVFAVVYLLLRYAFPWLLPFLLALALAAAVEPALRFVREKMHLKRSFLAAVATLLVVALTIAAAAGLLGALWRQVNDLLSRAPQLLGMLPQVMEQLSARLEEYRVTLPQSAQESVGKAVAAVGGILGDGAVKLSAALLDGITKLVGHLPGALLFCATVVMALFFTMSSYPQLRAFLLRQVPEEKQAAAKALKEGALGAVLKWLRAQIILITVTFLQLLAGLLLLRREYALLLALLIALMDALPIFGAGMALLPWAAVLGILGDVVGALGLTALYLVVWLVRSFLEPKLLGKSGGLPPLPSLLAIYVGWQAAGVAGMILGPLLLLLVKELHDRELLHLWK